MIDPFARYTFGSYTRLKRPPYKFSWWDVLIAFPFVIGIIFIIVITIYYLFVALHVENVS